VNIPVRKVRFRSVLQAPLRIVALLRCVIPRADGRIFLFRIVFRVEVMGEESRSVQNGENPGDIP